MNMTDADRQWVKDMIAASHAESDADIRDYVRKIVKDAMVEGIKNHVAVCPWGKKMVLIIALIIGVSIGSGLVSGFTIAKVLSGMI